MVVAGVPFQPGQVELEDCDQPLETVEGVGDSAETSHRGLVEGSSMCSSNAAADRHEGEVEMATEDFSFFPFETKLDSLVQKA